MMVIGDFDFNDAGIDKPRKLWVGVQFGNVTDLLQIRALGDHPKPATHDHLKTGQR